MNRLESSALRVTEVARRFLPRDQAVLYASQPRVSVHLDDKNGASPIAQLGGRPGLLNEPWPNRSEKPLDFLASIDLEAVAEFEMDLDLPTRGYLSFFYDSDAQPWGMNPGDRDGWRVLYTPDGEGVKVPHPDGVRVFDQILMCGKSSLTVPHFEEPILRPILGTDYSGMGVLRDIRVDLPDLHSESRVPRHQIGGWPEWMQAPRWDDCELGLRGISGLSPESSKAKSAKSFLGSLQDWQLLLQLETDDEGTGWAWAGSGVIYFAIRRPDLEALRFDQVWLVLQTA